MIKWGGKQLRKHFEHMPFGKQRLEMNYEPWVDKFDLKNFHREI